MSKNDFKSIEELVIFSKKSNLCMRWGCTTCGTLPFRHLVQEHLGLPRSSSLSLSPAESKYICEDLCKIEDTIGDESIEFLLRWISVNIQPTDILEILQQSSAGRYYEMMLEAKARRDEARRQHDMRNDPEFIKANREAKKQAKAEAHAERLRQKAMREGKNI